jgi:hypothetical protein
MVEHAGADLRRALAQLMDRPQQAVGDDAERDQCRNREQQPDAGDRQDRFRSGASGVMTP